MPTSTLAVHNKIEILFDTGVFMCYTLDMNIADIKKLSPVKIVYASISDGGQFYYNARPQRIVINNTLTGGQKRVNLLHEIGHAICNHTNCQCFNDSINHPLTEYHAFQFVMRHIKNDREAILQFAEEIEQLSIDNYHPNHKIAAQRIMRLKSWKRLTTEFYENN